MSVLPATSALNPTSEPAFSVLVDIGRGLLRITFNGFWSLATVDALAAKLGEVRKELAATKRLDVLERMLIVIRYQSVQPQDVAARLWASLTGRPNDKRRIAMVATGAQLQRMQVGRIVSSDHHRFFVSEAEATAWLFSTG